MHRILFIILKQIVHLIYFYCKMVQQIATARTDNNCEHKYKDILFDCLVSIYFLLLY